MPVVSCADPKLQTGAYVVRSGVLYRNLGHERDDNGLITGDYVLENAQGEYSASGVYVHKRITTTSTMLGRWYTLAREAPKFDSELTHLDEQITEHCKSAGLRV